MLTVLRCDDRIKEYATATNINTVLLAVGTCIGAMFGVGGVVVGRYVAFILSAIALLTYTRNSIEPIRKALALLSAEKKALWKYSVALQVSGGLNTLVYFLDITMISYLIANAEELALYKVATLIPTALVFIPNSVVVVILPNIAFNKDNKIWLKEYTRKYYIILGFANLVLCSILFACAPIIISILSGKAYINAVPYFRVLILSYLISGSIRILSINVLAAMRKVRFNLFISVISGVCNILLDYFLIKMFGTIGAAYATLLTMLISGLIAFGYFIYQIRIKTE